MISYEIGFPFHIQFALACKSAMQASQETSGKSWNSRDHIRTIVFRVKFLWPTRDWKINLPFELCISTWFVRLAVAEKKEWVKRFKRQIKKYRLGLPDAGVWIDCDPQWDNLIRTVKLATLWANSLRLRNMLSHKHCQGNEMWVWARGITGLSFD